MNKMVSLITASTLVLTFGAAFSFAADGGADSRITKSTTGELLLASGSKGKQADQEKSVEGTGGSEKAGESGGLGTGGTGTEGIGTGGTGTAGGGTENGQAGNGQAGSGAGGMSESGSSSNRM